VWGVCAESTEGYGADVIRWDGAADADGSIWHTECE